MNMWKMSIAGVGILVLVLSGFSVSAETMPDGTDDIYHWRSSGTSWGWEYNTGGKPNIDITEVTSVINGNQLTLTLAVSGVIVDSNLTTYLIYYSSDDETYWASYMNGEGMSLYSSSTGGGLGTSPVVSSNTISCTFDNFTGDPANFEVHGTATQYTKENSELAEYWTDYAPDSFFNGDDTEETNNSTNNNNNDNNGLPPRPSTPGFETLAVIAALGIALIILRRKN